MAVGRGLTASASSSLCSVQSMSRTLIAQLIDPTYLLTNVLKHVSGSILPASHAHKAERKSPTHQHFSLEPHSNAQLYPQVCKRRGRCWPPL